MERKRLLGWAGYTIIAAGVMIAVVVAAVLSVGVREFFASEAAAAWVQAVGSIAAIMVAIWIPFRQHEMARAQDQTRDLSEISAMVESIRQEFETSVVIFHERIGEDLERSEAGQGFWHLWPAPDRIFPIYESCAGQIGRIPSVDVRRSLVTAHSYAVGTVVSLRMNNQLIEAVHEAKKDHDIAVAGLTDISQATDQQRAVIRQLQDALEVHREYGDTLREGYIEARHAMNAFFNAVEHAEGLGVLVPYG